MQFARQPMSLDSGKARELNMDTSSSEYETPSVESGGLISVIEEEEEFSRVRMHNKNQDLVAEVMEKDKDTVRTRKWRFSGVYMNSQLDLFIVLA